MANGSHEGANPLSRSADPPAANGITGRQAPVFPVHAPIITSPGSLGITPANENESRLPGGTGEAASARLY